MAAWAHWQLAPQGQRPSFLTHLHAPSWTSTVAVWVSRSTVAETTKSSSSRVARTVPLQEPQFIFLVILRLIVCMVAVRGVEELSGSK